MKVDVFLNSVVLTTVVFAACIASITNIIISITNSSKLKKIEHTKQKNEINSYRYHKLYELILDWHKYDSELKGELAGEIAFYRLFNLFSDDLGRYEFTKPLLDKRFTQQLEPLKLSCEKLLGKLVEAESTEGLHSKDFSIIKDKYFESSGKFSELLKEVINTQIEILLQNNDIK